MKLYDTAQRQISEFKPPDDSVNIYVCGITPYDAAHLGHVFTFMTYDLLIRRLEDTGRMVRLVRNVTDVDEPIYARATELGLPYTELAKRETHSFRKVMRNLNLRQPDAEPLASEYISEMAAAVNDLLKNGYAYRLNEDIYYDVSKFPTFGNFSDFPYTLQTKLFAERGGDPGRMGKRNTLDFLLWRGITDPADPAAWQSVVGYGRPGWHIECSVMSSKLLGLPIDLHGGGMDLIFPHHECEIAQSESLHGAPFSRRWLHVASISLYGEKMSKSLGNLVFAKDLLAGGDAASIRLALMNYHFMTGGEWRPDLWEEAKLLSTQLRRYVKKGTVSKPTDLLQRVRSALDDNLNTPLILIMLRSHIAEQGSSRELFETLDLLGIPIAS